MDAYTRLSMEANRCRADAQACTGCMTKLAILAGAVRGRWRNARRSFVPFRRRALQLGATNGVACYDARSRPTRSDVRRRSRRVPAAREHADLARSEDCGFISGLSVDKQGVYAHELGTSATARCGSTRAPPSWSSIVRRWAGIYGSSNATT